MADPITPAAALRIFAEFADQIDSGGAKIVMDDAYGKFSAARAALPIAEAQEQCVRALRDIKSQVHNLPKTVTAVAIHNLCTDALGEERCAP